MVKMELIFDRGTLLIKDGTEDEPLVADFPCFKWDSRVRAHRAPAYKFSTLRNAFAARGILLNQPSKKQSKPAIARTPDLRPYQKAALSSWENLGKKGIVALPTGAGKTMVAIAAIQTLGLPTLCLVPTRVLLQQWHCVLSKYFEGSIGILGDGERRLESITIATFESAYRHMHTLGDRFDFLVVDEVHHFGNGLRDEALEMCLSFYRLGLTATYVSDENLRERLRELVGPLVYDISIRQLEGPYLAPFELVTIQVELNEEERRKYDSSVQKFQLFYRKFLQEFPCGAWSQFSKFASRSEEGRSAFFGWHQAKRIMHFPMAKKGAVWNLLAQHRKSKVLIFTADTATAYEIAREHFIMPVTSDIKRSEREEVLRDFQDGTLTSLVSCRVLNEGVDVPDADVAIVVGGTHGEREHIQRIGRCLRPREGKRATVYELVSRDTMEVKHWKKRTKSLVT